MNTTPYNRLDPSLIEAGQLKRLSQVLAHPGHIALVDESGNRTELPAHLFQHLVRIVRLMNENQAIVLIPEDETFTTQAAANFLGMSRQYLVSLLDKNEIPFHRVGSHRRIYFRDLLAYQERRDAERSQSLDRLRDQVEAAGLYFPESDTSNAR